MIIEDTTGISISLLVGMSSRVAEEERGGSIGCQPVKDGRFWLAGDNSPGMTCLRLTEQH